MGNPFARNAAIAIAEVSELPWILTSIAYNPEHPNAQHLAKLAPPLATELTRRTWLAPHGTTMHQAPLREILRILLLKAKIPQHLGLSPQRLTDWVYVALDHRVAQFYLAGLAGIYAYEDGAAATFTVAKHWGIKCFYDLPIVYYRHSQQIQQAEADRFPELAPALLSLREPAAKLARKDRELALADRVIVPSTIVKQSLQAAPVDRDRVHVVPFGAPTDYCIPQPKQHDQFRVLFVGRVGPRKGVHYLLQAWRSLKLTDAELHLVGVNEFPAGWLNPERDRFTYFPSVPHAQLLHHYSQASVLVLPSLVEGLALVQLEAIACGLPLITTVNAGGTDIITDGVEGFVVPIRDPEALQAKILWCYDHPDELGEMAIAARLRAEVLSWQRYRQQLQGIVQAVMV